MCSNALKVLMLIMFVRGTDSSQKDEKILFSSWMSQHVNIENEKSVNKIVMETRWIAVREVAEDVGLPQRFITGDEIWVYLYDVEIRVQSSQWKRPEEAEKGRQNR